MSGRPDPDDSQPVKEKKARLICTRERTRNENGQIAGIYSSESTRPKHSLLRGRVPIRAISDCGVSKCGESQKSETPAARERVAGERVKLEYTRTCLNHESKLGTPDLPPPVARQCHLGRKVPCPELFDQPPILDSRQRAALSMRRHWLRTRGLLCRIPHVAEDAKCPRRHV